MHILIKFLPIFFGCHQRADRSFFYKGKKLPICARCTGILIGWILGMVFAVAFDAVEWYYIICLVLPMLADAIIQQCTRYESNNIKRLISGILFGIGGIQVVLYIHYGTVELVKIFLRAIN